MKILVTGGAGYIGSHTIIEILERSDYEVVSIDNFCNSFPETFDRIEEITGKRVHNEAFDLSEAEPTRAFFEANPDIVGVIHFAALKAVGESMRKPLLYYQNNLNSLINLLSCCNEFGVKGFIFSSSCTVYGTLDELPATEAAPVKKQISSYGHTKYVGEQILEQYTQTNANFSSIALRYFNPVGAHPTGLNGEIPLGRPENLLPIITQTAIGIREGFSVYGDDYETRDGTCVRDYIHVSDIANAHLLALQHLLNDTKKENNFDIFNLGSGNGVTVMEIVNSFERLSGKKLNYEVGPRREGDLEAIYADNTKARTVLKWVPKYDLDHMISSAWKWEQHLRNSIRWEVDS